MLLQPFQNVQIRRRPSRWTTGLLPAAIAAPVSAAIGLLTGWLVFGRRSGASVQSGSGKRVGQAITRDPRAITPTAPVTEAARLMRQDDVGAVPVVENGRLVGLLTDRDIAMRLVADARDPQTTMVGEVASEQLVTVRPDEELDNALGLMARHQVRRLPVVENERLVGIVAQADAALEGTSRQAGEFLEQVSQPGPAPAA
jgi:CBS domain-containing protein